LEIFFVVPEHCRLAQVLRAMKNLTDAIGNVLKKKVLCTLLSRSSLWWRYEKPRPFLDGRVSLCNAVWFVPIIPMFITFREPGFLPQVFSAQKKSQRYIFCHLFTPNQTAERRENIALPSKSVV